jgi:hypothetical protein
MTNLENKAKIITLGGNEWNSKGMERVYISNEVLNILLDEQDISAVNFSERNNKMFFDVKANAVMRSYKGKTPASIIKY